MSVWVLRVLPGRALRSAAALLLLAVAIYAQGPRIENAKLVFQLPGYGALVQGSRMLVRRGEPVRRIEAPFLPASSDPELVFTIRGGQIRPDAPRAAKVVRRRRGHVLCTVRVQKSRMAQCGLSIVIPAYNEAGNIRAGVLRQISDFLDMCDFPSEVVVVDDGSVDDTAELIRAFVKDHGTFRLIQTSHGGKAHALILGMLAAEGGVVLFSDMDQAVSITEAAKILPWFSEGFDIVIGSRGFERHHAPRSRRLISYGQLLARRAVLGFGDIIDTQCGFKAFRREIVAPLLEALVVYGGARDARTHGARLTSGFDVELLFAAKKRGWSIKEVPVRWDHRHGRQAKLFRDCIRGLCDLMAIRVADWQGKYGRSPAVAASARKHETIQ